MNTMPVLRDDFDQDFVPEIKSKESFCPEFAEEDTESVFNVSEDSTPRQIRYLVKKKYFSSLSEEEIWKLRESTKDPLIDDFIFEKYQNFVIGFVKKYYYRYMDNFHVADDIIAQAFHGVYEAILRFDYRRGNNFMTYAKWWIQQKILGWMTENRRLVLFGRLRASRVARLNRVTNTYFSENGEMPSVIELSKILGFKEQYILFLQDYSRYSSSGDIIDSTYLTDENGEDISFFENFSSPELNDNDKFEIEYDRSVVISVIKEKFLTHFTPKVGQKYWEIFMEIHPFDGSEALTLFEAGEKRGVSRQRIYQVYKKCMDFIKSNKEIVRLLSEAVS